MSIQNIIDQAQQIEIDRRRMVSQSVSRSQRIKTAERSTAQPWKFKVTPPAQLPWAANRGVIEAIDAGDRVAEYQVSLNNRAGMNYITAYQGPLTQTQLDALNISATTTSTFTLNGLPAPGAYLADTSTIVTTSTIIFAPGDIIQPENSRYPYTVTSTVRRGSGSTVSVALHRPVITSEGITLTGNGLSVGNSCTWRVILMTIPTYTLIYGQRVQYNGDFEFMEKII